MYVHVMVKCSKIWAIVVYFFSFSESTYDLILLKLVGLVKIKAIKNEATTFL